MKNKLIIFSFFSTLSLSTPMISLSCSKTKNKTIENIDYGNDNENQNNNNLKDEEISSDDLKTSIQWIEGFKENEKNYHEIVLEFPFKVYEQIINNEDYIIKYVGHNSDVACYSLFIKELKKYYLCSLSASYEKFSKMFTKLKIKNFVSNAIINDFEQKMVVTHEVNNDDFFIPIDTSNNTLKFIKNEIINFKSSWSVDNSATRKLIFNININSNKIKEFIFGSNVNSFNNFFIENIKYQDLYILPKVITIFGPTNYFQFWINQILNNHDNSFYSLTKDDKNILSLEVPGKNGNKSQSWNGEINETKYSGSIVKNDFPDGIASIVSNNIEFDYEKINNSFINKIHNSNKTPISNYVNEIVYNGKKISLNINNENMSIDINTSIKSGANSSSIFGLETKNGIFNISCLQKVSFTLKEYKKI